jgi:hypothetical protein
MEGTNEGTITTTCNTPIIFSVATTAIQVIPTTEDIRYLDVYTTISSLDENDKPTSVSDTALFTVVNDKQATASTTSEEVTKVADTKTSPTTTTKTQTLDTQPTYTVIPATPAVTGPADLAITIKATGVSLENNEFVPTTLIPPTYRGAVKFVVENKGGAASGPWGFSATLPIQGASEYEYTSPLQPSLNAGDKIEFVLGFDQVLEEKTGVISITIVPVDKSDNTANNSVRTTVTIKN